MRLSLTPLVGPRCRSTIRILFTYGHTRQLASAAREHLVPLAGHTPCLAGIEQRCLVDIDSLLRPVYGHTKAGANLTDVAKELGYANHSLISKKLAKIRKQAQEFFGSN